MSSYYNPYRKSEWNYGGSKWRLSRSKIDLFLECPRCFYIDNKLGTKRPPGYPFSLNSAVDALLKKEFDIHRKDGKAHPLMEQYGIDAIPYTHKDLDVWRDNFQGVAYDHPTLEITVSGAIDDVWVHSDGNLLVVDYKATAKDGEVTLDAEWQDGYKRQMEVYQWLLRQNGFDVSDTGYFVYVNGNTDAEAFDGKLEFDVKVIPYTGDDSWVEETLSRIVETLKQDSVPDCAKDCDYCRYIKAVDEVVNEGDSADEEPAVKVEITTHSDGTLFG